MARLVEAHGLFGVLAGAGNPMTAITAAVYASTATEFVRIGVRVAVGLEHPITIAEELSILDNVNAGRTIVVADTAELDQESAADEIAVLREALANRPIQHAGPRWKVPAGHPANVTAPASISVTPKPAQLEIPFWLTGRHASAIGRVMSLPVVAAETREVHQPPLVQPAMTSITGSLNPDREHVIAWAATGVTHLLLAPPAGADLQALLTMLSRYLGPEVLMPHFPRVMSDSRVPLPWPGDRQA